MPKLKTGPKLKKFCIKGHNMNKTRKRSPSNHPYCSECSRIRSKEQHKLGLYKVQKKKTFRRWQLKKHYNMTEDDYLKLVKKYANKCAICRTNKIPKINRSKKYWCIDHCHKTGKIRGLLCRRCNLALGAFEDSTILLKSAKKYLEKSC